MVADKCSLETLPTEILNQCFSHLDPTRQSDQLPPLSGPSPLFRTSQDVKNLRLVSKKCNELISPYLIGCIRVFLASDSLLRLEAFSKNPAISKGIKTVQLNVSYYDTMLAQDRTLYANHCAHHLSGDIDRAEHYGGGGANLSSADYASAEWFKVAKGGFRERGCSERQTFLLEAYDEYCRRWKDQESVKLGGNHITRICKALANLRNLQLIEIGDDARYTAYPLSSYKSKQNPSREYGTTTNIASFSDDDLLESYCLTASEWKGSYTTSNLTKSPVEVIPDLLEALSISPMPPLTKFKIFITPPDNLRIMQVFKPRRRSIQKALNLSRELTCEVRDWRRKDSLAEDNSRPRDEMLGLCCLTTALFSSENLTSLTLAFQDYPTWYEIPQVSLADILPLDTAWYRLRELNLSHIPFKVSELETVVERLKTTLTVFTGNSIYLLDGSWVEAVDVFRGLESLKICVLTNPKGQVFGDEKGWTPDTPTEAMRDYVLRKIDTNPLLNYR